MCCPSLCENPLHGKFLLVFLFFDSKMSMDKNFHSALTRSKHQWDAHCDFCMPPVAIVFLMFCSKTKTGWQQVDSLTFKYFTYSNQNALCEVRKVYPFQIAVWCGLVVWSMCNTLDKPQVSCFERPKHLNYFRNWYSFRINLKMHDYMLTV